MKIKRFWECIEAWDFLYQAFKVIWRWNVLLDAQYDLLLFGKYMFPQLLKLCSWMNDDICDIILYCGKI